MDNNLKLNRTVINLIIILFVITQSVTVTSNIAREKRSSHVALSDEASVQANQDDFIASPKRLEFTAKVKSHRKGKDRGKSMKEKNHRRTKNEESSSEESVPEIEKRVERIKDPDKYLEKYGYLPELNQDRQHSPESRTDAIRNFQRMAGMEATGDLDRKTLEMMAKPRCGMPDMMPDNMNISVDVGRAGSPLGIKAARFYVPGYKWTKTNLRWRADNYSPDMSHSSQRRAFINAFKHWAKVTPLTFYESTQQEVDIEIKFGSYEHGDGVGNSFDGKSGTLAHAFFPENGDTHFDESEDWTEYTEQGTNLEIVAAHEFGHALGLGHSGDQSALMAPFYQGYDSNFQLHSDDIQGIQSLYGAKMRPTQRPPTRTTTPRPRITTKKPSKPSTPKSRPELCAGRFDDVMQDQHGSIYAYVGKWLYKMNYWEVEDGWPQRSGKLYQKGHTPPYSPRAVVHSWRTRYTYFFKKNRIYKYYGYRRISKKTITSNDYPLPQAAFIARDGKIYILSGDFYWVFDETRLDLVPRSRGRISGKWPGVKGGVTASVRLSDGYIYFFKGAKYRKYNERYRRVEGNQKVTAPAWMGPKCSSNNRYTPK